MIIHPEKFLKFLVHLKVKCTVVDRKARKNVGISNDLVQATLTEEANCRIWLEFHLLLRDFTGWQFHEIT